MFSTKLRWTKINFRQIFISTKIWIKNFLPKLLSTKICFDQKTSTTIYFDQKTSTKLSFDQNFFPAKSTKIHFEQKSWTKIPFEQKKSTNISFDQKNSTKISNFGNLSKRKILKNRFFNLSKSHEQFEFDQINIDEKFKK